MQWKHLMGQKFNTIGLFSRTINHQIVQTLRVAIDYLKALDVNVVLESNTSKAIDSPPFPTYEAHELAHHCDLVLVVGGDGSFVTAAHLVVDHDTPLLGINRGKLGFLTDIRPDEMQKIKDVLEGHYREEPRVMLSAKVAHQDKPHYVGKALNEVVLSPGAVAHMIEFTVTVDDQFVCNQRADGLIVATPTGSTAYALSGGGPILQPQSKVIVIVPMFPHTLSSRPLVVSDHCKIKLTITKGTDPAPCLSCDGQPREPIAPGTDIYIEKKPERVRLIHPIDYNYYETLRNKLRWGKKSYEG